MGKLYLAQSCTQSLENKDDDHLHTDVEENLFIDMSPASKQTVERTSRPLGTISVDAMMIAQQNNNTIICAVAETLFFLILLSFYLF